ncbi:MAG: hypothetical protein NTY30_04585 [Candidatus Berkelbacteria bacterium]|nr:hypothetical protein [Candidatus Berkelbacteria bacterium]
MNKTELIQFLRANEIWAKRTMGQNFLVDGEALAKIVEAADISFTTRLFLLRLCQRGS